MESKFVTSTLNNIKIMLNAIGNRADAHAIHQEVDTMLDKLRDRWQLFEYGAIRPSMLDADDQGSMYWTMIVPEVDAVVFNGVHDETTDHLVGVANEMYWAMAQWFAFNSDPDVTVKNFAAQSFNPLAVLLANR